MGADALGRLPQIADHDAEKLDATINNKSFYQECFTQKTVLPPINYARIAAEQQKDKDLQET